MKVIKNVVKKQTTYKSKIIYNNDNYGHGVHSSRWL